MNYDSVVALLNPAMSAIYCASLLVLWQHQRHLTYIAIFALSYAIRGLCFGTLYFAFIQEAPALRTAANSLVLLAMILLSVALSRRYDQQPRYGILFAIGTLSLATLYFYQFVEPSLWVRAVVLNWALAAVCLVMLVDVLRYPYRTAVDQLFFGLVVLACMGFLLRPLAFQIPGIAADQIEAAYWLIVSTTDALICSTLGVAIFAIIAVDITAGIKAEAQIDPLSGLFNRRGFDLRGRAALARQRPGTPVAAMRVPSTARSSRPNRSSCRHRMTNSRNTCLKADRFTRRKSAMVRKSGFRCRSSQITSILRWASASSRRLDRTRLM